MSNAKCLEAPQADPVEKISISLPKSLLSRLDELCTSQRRSRSGQVQFLVEEAKRKEAEEEGR